MVKIDSSILEADRFAALRERNALSYYTLCRRLGYTDRAIEDTDLYAQGLELFRAAPEVTGYLDNNAASDESPTFDPHKVRQLLSDRRIGVHGARVSKLSLLAAFRKVEKTGFPLPRYEHLDYEGLWQLGMSVRDKIRPAITSSRRSR